MSFQVVYYSTTIFRSAGLSYETAQYSTLGIGGVLVVMTFISAILVDQMGRRSLHLAGLSGMWVFGIALTAAFTLEVTFINLNI